MNHPARKQPYWQSHKFIKQIRVKIPGMAFELKKSARGASQLREMKI